MLCKTYLEFLIPYEIQVKNKMLDLSRVFDTILMTLEMIFSNKYWDIQNKFLFEVLFAPYPFKYFL